MQPVSIGSAVGSRKEASLTSSQLASSHWDLRREIAIEHLRNSKAGYYSSGPRHFQTAPSATPRQATTSAGVETGAVRFGKPVGIAEAQPGKRSFLPPIAIPPVFRRRGLVAQGQGEAAVMDFPAYGHAIGAKHQSKTDTKTKKSAISIKKIVAFALVVVMTFTFLYSLTNGVVSSIPNQTVGLKEAFFFSLRSFLTSSSFDLAPVNTMGRLLFSIEEVIGFMTMIVTSIVVSEKVVKL